MTTTTTCSTHASADGQPRALAITMVVRSRFKRAETVDDRQRSSPSLGWQGQGSQKKNLLFSPRPFLYRSKQNLTRVGHWAAEGKGHVHRQTFLSSIASSRLTPEQRRLCSCWFCVLSLWFQHFHAAWRMNHKLETQISWVIQAARAGFQSIHLSIHPCIFFLSFAGLSSPANLPHPVGFCCPPPPPS